MKIESGVSGSTSDWKITPEQDQMLFNLLVDMCKKTISHGMPNEDGIECGLGTIHGILKLTVGS
jgi:hypothetical protein